MSLEVFDGNKIGDFMRGRIESGPLVVDSFVKFSFVLDSWKKYSQVYHVASTLQSNTAVVVWTSWTVVLVVAGSDSAPSALHCVRSWFARDNGSLHQEMTPEVV